MFRYLALTVAALACTWISITPANAQQAIQCRSVNGQYNECRAGPMRRPVLVQQTSKSACIRERTWGYNSQTHYLWVGSGCSGIFADAGRPAASAQHAGRNELGAAVAGTILGAVLEGMAEDNHHHRAKHSRGRGYDGCHGIGCDVDNPDDEIDTRPQFDRQGNPNFDTHGNYQGCHDIGCDVDDPDD